MLKYNSLIYTTFAGEQIEMTIGGKKEYEFCEEDIECMAQLSMNIRNRSAVVTYEDESEDDDDDDDDCREQVSSLKEREIHPFQDQVGLIGGGRDKVTAHVTESEVEDVEDRESEIVRVRGMYHGKFDDKVRTKVKISAIKDVGDVGAVNVLRWNKHRLAKKCDTFVTHVSLKCEMENPSSLNARVVMSVIGDELVPIKEYVIEPNTVLMVEKNLTLSEYRKDYLENTGNGIFLDFFEVDKRAIRIRASFISRVIVTGLGQMNRSMIERNLEDKSLTVAFKSIFTGLGDWKPDIKYYSDAMRIGSSVFHIFLRYSKFEMEVFVRSERNEILDSLILSVTKGDREEVILFRAFQIELKTGKAVGTKVGIFDPGKLNQCSFVLDDCISVVTQISRRKI